MKLCEASSTEIHCERIVDDHWSQLVGTVKTCFVDNTTSIEAQGAKMSDHVEEDSGIDFFDNSNIKFLPENVAEKFPNLIGYLVHRCSVQEISKKNFKNLSKLKYLWLGYNQIVKIPRNTFEDLVKLEQIYLGKVTKWVLICNFILIFLFSVNNKLKQLNGNAFESLKNLKQIWFKSNPCIGDNFGYKKSNQNFREIVTKKCGYRE